MKEFQPVFILGNPRSGTSLLRIILHNHDYIVAPPESGFSQWWCKKYQDWEIDDINSPRLDAFLKDLSTSKKIETWELDFTVVKNVIHENKPSNYGELVACIYLCYAEVPTGIRVICDKNNYYIHHVPELFKIWPNAQYIHLLRDGRDVACSYLDLVDIQTQSKYKPSLSTSVFQIAEEWKQNNKKIAELSRLGVERYFLVKYEDLISDSKATVERLCDFLKIKFSAKMLEYYKTSQRDKMEPSETMDWKKRTKEKPDAKRIGRYKQDLSKDYIDKFTSIAGDALNKYGYD